LKVIPQALSESASADLNLIRGLAAVAVAAGHLRGLFFAEWHQVPQKSALLGVFYALTGLGHQAVMVFFVMSGFLISSSIFKSASIQWSWKRYLTNRLTRLYIVLIPALLLGALFDYTGSHLPVGRHYYTQALLNFTDQPFVEHLSGSVFLGNIFFLQTIAVPTFGSNGPLWSLANEFWYYMLFPLLMLLCIGKRPAPEKVLYGVLALLLLFNLPSSITRGFGVWLMGAALHFLPKLHANYARALSSWGVILGVAWFAISLLLSKVWTSADWGSEYFIGGAFVFLLYCLLHGDRANLNKRYAGSAAMLAGFSYSLYVAHFPLLILVRAISANSGGWYPTASNLMIAGVILVGTLAYAIVFSKMTEGRTDRVRNAVLALMERRAAYALSIASPD
jgi:peptidoglycan/LPS O-acetylase OafA/YrhL